MSTKILCDRCEEVIADNDSIATLSMTIYGATKGGKEAEVEEESSMDLCAPCADYVKGDIEEFVG